jgi:cellulose synthase/poly-beta-1,6-N-acetylglucosamine synthase-like glycosyltransferase
MRLDLVTDLPVDLPHIRVPEDFTTKHARFKARALEYYRLVMNLSEDDWVLHLDEETVLDEDSLEACIRFCKRSPHFMGQGIIIYNNYGFWKNRVITVADAVRTGDDMGRFFAQLAWFHRPIFGVHGSFLLVNGAVENEITWDLKGYLVEDYAFSLHYMQRGYSCGHIDGFAREQSPLTLLDFLKQRRRWIVGMRSLSYQSLWPAYWVTLWQMAPFGRALAATASLTRFGPWWFVLSSEFAFVTYLYLYLVGMLIQEVDRGNSFRTIAWHLMQVVVLFPFAIFLETAGVAWAIFTREKTLSFQVVKK